MHVTFRKFEAVELVLKAYDMKLDKYGQAVNKTKDWPNCLKK